MDVVDKVEVEGTSKGKGKGNVLVGIAPKLCVRNLCIYVSPAEGDAPNALSFFRHFENLHSFP